MEYTFFEPVITKVISDKVEKSKGRLIGLEYKLKSRSSLFRKIMSGEVDYAGFVLKMIDFATQK